MKVSCKEILVEPKLMIFSYMTGEKKKACETCGSSQTDVPGVGVHCICSLECYKAQQKADIEKIEIAIRFKKALMGSQFSLTSLHDSQYQDVAPVIVSDNEMQDPGLAAPSVVRSSIRYSIRKSRRGKTKKRRGEQTEYSYRMDYPKRGFHLIFAQELFDNEIKGLELLESRDGTEADVVSLIEAYTQLGFKNKVFLNKGLAALMQILAYYACYNHAEHDCIAVTILTHGNTNELYARDASFPIDELWKPFYADNCPSLAGKPKLFVFQACKGNRVNPGVKLLRADSLSKVIIPTQDDFILAFSTWQGDVSYRDSEMGSIYIQALCEVILADIRREKDWVTILENAKRKTKEIFNRRWPQATQCPNNQSSLNGKVWFSKKKTYCIYVAADPETAVSENDEEFFNAFSRLSINLF